MYSRSLSKKHQSLIKHVYEQLDLKELTKLKLIIDEGLVANLTFPERAQHVIKNVIKKRIFLNVVCVPIGLSR